MVAIKENNNSFSKLRTFIRDAEEAHDEKLQRASINKDFRRGHQWTEEEERTYKTKGVRPITINHILPITNSISGLQAQNKQDIRVRPRKGGTDTVAGVLTELVKHTMDVCDGQDIVSQSFTQGLITSEDFLKIVINNTANANGQTEITRHSLFEVLPDPNAKEYDLNKSAKYIVHRYWQDKDELSAIYDLENAEYLGYNDSEDQKLDELMDYFFEDEHFEEKDVNSGIVKKYRALRYDIWWKEKVKAIAWKDKETGDIKVLTDAKHIKRARASVKFMPERFEIKNTFQTILHLSVTAANRMLEDTVNPLGEDISIFPFVRFAPYWDDGYAFGVIDNLIGPQREENINRTQATRLINQTANAGWIVNKIVKPGYKKIIEMFGALPGVVLERESCGGHLEKITPNQISTGHAALAERSVTDMKEISSANDAMQGYNTGKAESGRAIELQRRQGQQSIEPIMRNFDWSLKLAGKIIIELIRKLDIYTPEEIRAVIDESKLIDARLMSEAEQMFELRPQQPQIPQKPDPERMAMLEPLDQLKVKRQFEAAAKRAMPEIQRFQQMMPNYEQLIRRQAQEILFQKLKSDTTGSYGITVDLSPEAPTIQIANMIELSEIAKNYPGELPITSYIKNSGITNKEEIMTEIREAQQQRMRVQRQMQMQGAV